MRLVFAQVNAWIGLMSGGLIAQRLCAEGIARLGHECHALVRLFDPANDRPHVLGHPTDSLEHTVHQTREALDARAIPYREIPGPGIVFERNGVEVHAIGGTYGTFCAYLERFLRDRRPDWVQVTDADDGPPFLEICQREAGGRLVAHLHSVAYLPFGPLSMFPPDPRRTEELRAIRGVICPSRFGRDYAKRYAGIDAEALYYPTYGEGPWPDHAQPERGHVTLINPCVLKGLPIFVELARAMPDVAFAAVPTWGSDQQVLDTLEALPNVDIWPPQEDVDRVLSRTRVLLAPALWQETFGLTVVEAMLRGLPVLASDLGGHRESKLGVDYLLPARPLAYEDADGQRRAILPEQDVGPWVEALRGLLADRAEYERVSRASREAARGFARGLSWQPFIDYMARLEA